MSFCPTKDIHSVYLDNEMPEIYKAEYEAHIATCSKCKKEVEQMKAIRFALQSDAKAIAPDSKFMEDSFARLQMKMTYSKNVAKSSGKKYSYYSYAAGIAAAAALAFFIPLNINKSAESVAAANGVSTIMPISATTSANNVSFNSGRSVLVSGNIQETIISSNKDENIQSAITQNAKNVDVLRPNFGDESISIRITVPGMGSTPVVTEITLPTEIVSGRF